MNKKRIVIVIISMVVLSIISVCYVFRDTPERKIDTVAVNDIVKNLARQWNQTGFHELPGLQYGIDYAVLDQDSVCLAQTSQELNTDLNSAIRNRDTIVDIKQKDEVVGKLIIFNDYDTLWANYQQDFLVSSIAIILIIGLFCILYVFYLDKSIFRPFLKLKRFARHVAQGQLTIPLDMDKGNRFGAFTESFDLMRSELDKARESERAANQSKKELVASLSHDIKTPIASIKAVTELLQAKTGDENVKKQLDVITTKADQINTLITNMFTATLEELQELKVDVTEQSSVLLYDLIQEADYNHQVTISKKAECIILADELRLSQVIDNVISNSYKYAGTSIEVSFQIKGNFLEVTFLDYGLGVEKEEEQLIFRKFYRAKNSKNKSGSGLGLYISKYLMEKMSGAIECETLQGSFALKIKLKIA